jgi:hypothetical protein
MTCYVTVFQGASSNPRSGKLVDFQTHVVLLTHVARQSQNLSVEVSRDAASAYFIQQTEQHSSGAP